MTDKIRAYIDHAFAEIPQTTKVRELKEELFANLCEKYEDQLQGGKTPEEAYRDAIAGIGDLSELVDSIRESQPLLPMDAKTRSTRALFVSVAVGIYIISFLALPIFSVSFDNPMAGMGIMFLLIAFATGLLIYNAMTRPSYTKSDESLVEDFKEYRASSQKEKSIYHSFQGAYWSLVVALYLLASFLFNLWSFSWILFIVAMAVERIASGIYLLKSANRKREAKHSFRGGYWSLVVAIYLIASFTFVSWAYSWILFIIAVAVERLISGILQLKGENDEQ